MSVVQGDRAVDRTGFAAFGAWGVVILFGLANAVSFLDRGFLNLVLDTVRRHFGLTDTQMGILIGPVFMLCYSVVALPLGALADRANRKRMIVAGVAFWSFCTGLFGLAGSFPILAAARMGVGLGEATLTPAAVSIISDYFSRTRVGRAVALFTAMAAVGGSSAFILGGMLMARLTALGPITLGTGWTLEPWQAAFLIISTPGIVLSVLIGLLVREPNRDQCKLTETPAGAGWKETLTYMGRHPRATIALLAGFSLISAGASSGAWLATFFLRSYGWGPARAGPYIGAVQLLAGFAGVFCGGALADGLRRRGREDANVLVALSALAIAIPCDLILPNTGSPYLSLGIMAPAVFCTMACFGAATPAFAMISPPPLRAKFVSLYLVGGNLAGIGLGPVIVPLFTDYLFHDAAALRHSLTLAPALLLPLAFGLLAIARGPFRDLVSDLREASPQA